MFLNLINPSKTTSTPVDVTLWLAAVLIGGGISNIMSLRMYRIMILLYYDTFIGIYIVS